jgi:hypothetical protein
MTKGGVTLFTKSAALEFARKAYRIRVNSIHPGVIQTDMGEQTFVARAQRTGSNDTCASSKPHPTRSCYYRASIKRLKRGGVHGLAMAQSDPTSGSEARGPRCGMRSPPPSSGDPAALKVEASAVRSVGSIALGLPFPILAAMARGADPCSGRDCLALGPTARRPHAPPTKVSAQQARWSAENRCRDSGPDQPYGARQYALGRTTHPR